MNPHTNYFAVGLFLLVGLASLVVLVMWLGQAGDTTPKSRYMVEIVGDVNGLSNGSVVTYLGVNVGSVVKIRLHTEARPFVEVWIEIEQQVPVDDTTYATLVTQGVTGISTIDLGSHSDPANPLDRPSTRHENGDVVIPFKATGLSAMLAGSGDLTVDAGRLLARLNAWAGEENRSRVEGILDDVRALTSALATRREDIPAMMISLKRAIASLERTANGLEAVVGDDLPVVAEELRATSANLASASARVDGWLADNDASVDRLLGEGLDSISDLALDLRELAEKLSTLSNRLKEDPSRLIYQGNHDPVVVEP